MMKISKEIVEILKNFSLINKSIMIYEGEKIRTISENKNVFAEYIMPSDKFPKDFGIYSISEFLSVLSLFEEPEIDFKDTYMKIYSSTENTSVKYVYANENVIISPGRDKNIKFSSFDLNFTLTAENLSIIKKAASILKGDELVVTADLEDNKIAHLQVQNPVNASSNTFDLKVEMNEVCENNYKFRLNTEHLILMQGDYNVKFSEKGIVKFESLDSKLVYFVPTLRN